MDNLFKRAICFTDIHVGLKNNSRRHNIDCEEYIEWFISMAKQEQAETCIFLGDFHHNRNSINILSLQYTMKILRRLNEEFEQVYMITGNHDLFYREKRDVHSMVMLSEFANITLVDQPLIKGDVAIIPWLVDDEWQQIKEINSKYMFGHFEIPGFKMNAMIEMPDHGQINKRHFKHQEYVFSGHFHKRQDDGQIHYIGNPFGHNYADSWDFDRGCMVLEWGGVPKYINWEDGPRYITCTLSQLLGNVEELMSPSTHAKVILDGPISYEESNYIKETIMTTYNIRELKMISESKDSLDMESVDITHQTVDEIVVEQLLGIDSTNFDTKKLLDIYTGL